MQATFIYQNTEYLAFDTNADEFKNLNISEEDKLKIAKNINYENTLSKRQAAYKAESDPLYMEAQYDGTPESMQKWQDKVAEIKARYPLPDNA